MRGPSLCRSALESNSGLRLSSMDDWLWCVRCCLGNLRAVPLAALEAPLLLCCPTACLPLLLLLLLFAAAIALQFDNQFPIMRTRYTGHAATACAIHDDQHVQAAAHARALVGSFERVASSSGARGSRGVSPPVSILAPTDPILDNNFAN